MEQIVVSHHLQAFSPGVFRKEGKLFSYSQENLNKAALKALVPLKERRPFINGFS